MKTCVVKPRRNSFLGMFLAVIFLFFVPSCATPVPVITEAPTAQLVTATAVLIPSAPPATGTLERPVVHVVGPISNIRAGPGTDYQIIGTMKLGDQANIIGRNAAASWWVIETADLRGWIANNPAFIQITGGTEGLPLAAPPPTSTAEQRPTKAVIPAPILYIDHISLDPPSPVVDQPFTVTISIGNRGNADAEASPLFCTFQPDNLRQTTEGAPIKAGENSTLNFRLTLHREGLNFAASCQLIDKLTRTAIDIQTIFYNVVGPNGLVEPTATPIRPTLRSGTG